MSEIVTGTVRNRTIVTVTECIVEDSDYVQRQQSF